MPPRAARLERRNSEDPLTLAMAPPPDETEEQKAERLNAEAEAKRISDLIDEELNKQRQAERRGPRPVKLLLLGVYKGLVHLLNYSKTSTLHCNRSKRVR